MQLANGTLLQGGKYRIEKVLGHGGFGITYLANQCLLERQVCIKEFFFKDYCERENGKKVSLGTAGSKDFVDRFKTKFMKEAAIISKLQHPNIISILDIFEENGTAYYVMEYIKGGSLSDIVARRGKLEESIAIRYIKKIGDALSYIHDRKINHLDVKPANIMVREIDNEPILIDFGLAKQYDVMTGGQTSTTPVGISHGYAPIEQYKQGGVSSFSPSTDIYSLAATLYKLVTGNNPPSALDLGEYGLPDYEASKSTKLAIDKAMQQFQSKRPKNMKYWLEMLETSNDTTIVEHTSSKDSETTIITNPHKKQKKEKVNENRHSHVNKEKEDSYDYTVKLWKDLGYEVFWTKTDNRLAVIVVFLSILELLTWKIEGIIYFVFVILLSIIWSVSCWKKKQIHGNKLFLCIISLIGALLYAWILYKYHDSI